MCASPVIYPSRAAAERALWMLAAEDQVLIEDDRRYRALVLLATFASLRCRDADRWIAEALDARIKAERPGEGGAADVLAPSG